MTTTTETSRPSAPPGSVYLQDVLDLVAEHADANTWCSEAEELTAAAFNLGDSGRVFLPARAYCCSNCHGDLATFRRANNNKRFQLRDNADRTVTLLTLKDAVRYAQTKANSRYHMALYRDIHNRFGLPPLRAVY